VLLLTENPLLLYPLALLSAVSVLLILTLAYTMAWVLFRHRENQFARLRDLSSYLSLGFTTALLQIAIMADYSACR